MVKEDPLAASSPCLKGRSWGEKLHRCDLYRNCFNKHRFFFKKSTKRKVHTTRKRHIKGLVKGIVTCHCYLLFFFNEQDGFEIEDKETTRVAKWSQYKVGGECPPRHLGEGSRPSALGWLWYWLTGHSEHTLGNRGRHRDRLWMWAWSMSNFQKWIKCKIQNLLIRKSNF